MLHLIEEDKLVEAEDIDSIICAELPDPIQEPDLFSIVKACGVANPKCPCMEDGKCTKDYPKDFCDSTSPNTEGYPKYRRRSDGRTVNVKCPDGKFVLLDNRNVVPYCPWLTKNLMHISMLKHVYH